MRSGAAYPPPRLGSYLSTSTYWFLDFPFLDYWVVLKASWSVLEVSLGFLEMFWGVWEVFWRRLGASWRRLGASWGVLEASPDDTQSDACRYACVFTPNSLQKISQKQRKVLFSTKRTWIHIWIISSSRSSQVSTSVSWSVSSSPPALGNHRQRLRCLIFAIAPIAPFSSTCQFKSGRTFCWLHCQLLDARLVIRKSELTYPSLLHHIQWLRSWRTEHLRVEKLRNLVPETPPKLRSGTGTRQLTLAPMLSYLRCR